MGACLKQHEVKLLADDSIDSSLHNRLKGV